MKAPTLAAILLSLQLVAASSEAADDLVLVTSKPVFVKVESQQPRGKLAQFSKMAQQQASGDDSGMLGADFLRLFDEIWRIKSQSSLTLLENQQFVNNWRGLRIPSAPTTTPSSTNTNADLDEQQVLDEERRLATSVTLMKGPLVLKKAPLMANVAAAKHQQVSSLAGQFNAWLQQLNSKLTKAAQVAVKPLAIMGLQARKPARGQTTMAGEEEPLGSLPPSVAELEAVSRERRQADLLDNTNNNINGGQEAATCARLSQEQINECRFAELQVSSGLNSSFPGTALAINDNCRHITYLLTNCWPDQLQTIRTAMAGRWNESLQTIQSTEFQLPPLQQEESLQSCGLRAQIAQQQLERANWMWLNLCLDKKFRRDYLDNQRCLSLWSQDRAQAVCPHEYRRLQGETVQEVATTNQHQSAPSNQRQAAKQAPRRFPQVDIQQQQQQHSEPPSDHQLAAANITANRHLSQELASRELETKTLCCVFDSFLRCVHKQATRDCGRAGAQFVVNFMARIGTEDFKYLCNNDSRTSAATSKPASSRPTASGPRRGGGGTEVNAPFIDRLYCSDPRLSSLLRPGGFSGQQGDQDVTRFPGNDPYQKSRPIPGGGGGGGGGLRTNTRGPNSINHDPSYYGTDSAQVESGASSLGALACFTVASSSMLTIVVSHIHRL